MTFNPPPGDGRVAFGLDGGASRFKWVLHLPSGELRHGDAPGANPQLLGWNRFGDRLSEVVAEALARAGLAPDQVEAAGLGLAGAGTPDAIARVRGWLPAMLPGLARAWVGNDAETALRLGAGRLEGIVLVAGSGSFCFGRTRDGQSVRAGGWGNELGDEGSAFWIGRYALNMCARMADGRVEVTGLLGEILGRLGLDVARGLVDWANQLDRGAFTRETAALAPVVIELAGGGDSAARQILARGIDLLIEQVQTVARRLDQLEPDCAPVIHDTPLASAELPPRPLVCAGGLFAHHDPFYAGFEQALACHPRSFRLIRLVEPPALGALALGLEAAGEGSG